MSEQENTIPTETAETNPEPRPHCRLCAHKKCLAALVLGVAAIAALITFLARRRRHE